MTNSLAGDHFNQFADITEEFNEHFYDTLLPLLRHSFATPPDNVLKKVRESMPTLANKLHDSIHTTTQNLKVAVEVAEKIGVRDIHRAKRVNETRLIFEATMVLLLYIGIKRNIYHRPSIRFYENYNELQIDYDNQTPGFEDVNSIDAMERRKLVHFANFMKTILLLIPFPKWKRAHLLDIVTRLSEGIHTIQYYRFQSHVHDIYKSLSSYSI